MKVVCQNKICQCFFILAIIFSFPLFLKCYFPLKQGLRGFASIENSLPEPFSDQHGLPTATFQRLVLLVIDALRTDFVLGNNLYMPFTRKLLSNGNGIAFSAKTHLPTVTLPRIKAITSGSIPGFVDVVMNFGSAAFTDDNLITQLKLAGKMLTFFGDDTWLSLFPHHFTRADGTTSFFVTDYTEVDHNVTLHLSEELSSDDWEAMTLHYLGLDHIGHLYGPTSNLVTPKLLEMDQVVQQIYTAMASWSGDRPSLLVLCGDHGMSDQGGHGGASVGETSVPVIFLSPHVHFHPNTEKKQELQQIDLCPTLSALLGLPIPRNNLGKVELRALPVDTPVRHKVRWLQLNAAQIAKVLNENVGNVETDHVYQQYQHTVKAHSLWLASQNSSSAASWEVAGQHILKGYEDVIQRMSHKVSQMSTTYDLYGMYLAITFLWMNFVIQVCLRLNPGENSVHICSVTAVMFLLLAILSVLGHVTVCTSHQSSDILCGTSVVSLAAQTVALVTWLSSCVLVGSLVPTAVKTIFKDKSQSSSTNWASKILVAFCICHSLSLMSSSFVEEEHQTWYFFASTFHTLILFSVIAQFLGGEKLVSLVKEVNCDVATPTETSSMPEHREKIRTPVCSFIENSRLMSSSSGDGGWKEDLESKQHVNRHQQVKEQRGVQRPRRKNENTDQRTEEQRNLHGCTKEHGNTNWKSKEHFTEKYEDVHQRTEQERNLHDFTQEFRRTYQREQSALQHTKEQIWHYRRLRAFAGLMTMLVLLRILRRWNQTGNKWLNVPDVGDWLVRQENKVYLCILVLSCLLIIFLSRVSNLHGVVSQLLFTVALTAVFLSRVGSGSLSLPTSALAFVSQQGVLEARMVYLCVFLLLLNTVWKKSRPPQLHNSTHPQLSQENFAHSHCTAAVSGDNSGILSRNTKKCSQKHADVKVDCNKHSAQTLNSDLIHVDSTTTEGKGSSTFAEEAFEAADFSTGSPTESFANNLTTDPAVWKIMQAAWLCMMCLLLRPHNIAVACMMSVVETLATSFVVPYLNSHPSSIFLYCLMMGQATFFFQGNSNSLSTVDVSASMTALYSYHPVVCGTQLFLATYASIIFWLITAGKLLSASSHCNNVRTAWTEFSSAALLTRVMPLSVYTVLVTIMRFHLFVWTVFSPKLLYEGTLTIVMAVFCSACLLITGTLKKNKANCL